MQAEATPTRPLILPLLVRTYEIWSLESSWFLFYGFFMLAAALAVGQVPLVGLFVSLALDGPLAGGLVLATRRVLLGERPGIEDFMGGFRRAPALALIALGVAAMSAAGLLLLVVPGLLLSALFCVATPIVMLEGAAPRAALQASARLTRPAMWPVAALMAAQALVQVLLSLPAMSALLKGSEPTLAQTLPLFLGLGLLGPFHGIFITVLYQRLKLNLDL